MPSNIKVIGFDKENLGYGEPMASFSAFIETRSNNQKVFVSIVETHAQVPISVSARAYRYGSNDGILVTATYATPVQSAGLTLSIMQEGVQESAYQDPIRI